MLLKFFKRPLPSVFTAIIIIAILSWLKSFLSEENFPFYFDNNAMPLYSIVLNIVNGSVFWERALAFLVIVISALYLIQLNTKHILIKYRTYLPTLFFILLSSSFLPLQRINPAIFATFFLILALDNLFSAYESSKSLDHLYKASFLVSIASLFYFPAIFYIGLVIISLFILRSIGFRDWIVSIFGFITPWFFLFFYHYFFNNNIQAIPDIVSNAIEPIDVIRYYGVVFTVFYSFAGFILIISSIFLLSSFPTQKISTRKYLGIFLWFIIISTLIAFFSRFSSIEIIYLAAIPATFIFSTFFTFSRNRFWPEFFFTTLVLVAVLMQFLM